MVCKRLLKVLVCGLMVFATAHVCAGIDEVQVGDPRNGPPDDPNNVNSRWPRVSRSGVFVAFHCFASNVVEDDTNSASDVFILNRYTGEVVRASVHTDGSQSDGSSQFPQISGNGRYTVFASLATNLVDGDTNNVWDVFRYDRITQTTDRMSVSSNGSQADGESADAAISADGRYVVFASFATDLVSGDTNGAADIFVRDTWENTTSRISLDANGGQVNGDCREPSISFDGRYIAFRSAASDIVSNDTNEKFDVFIRDTVAGTNYRASVASDGTQGNDFSIKPAISGDGRYVAFISGASNIIDDSDPNKEWWDCFLHDTETGQTVAASISSAGVFGDGNTLSCDVAGDGSRVVFHSNAKNLVPQDTNNRKDVFVRDLIENTTTRVSVNEDGQQGNDDSYEAALSETGEHAVFLSQSTNLDEEATDPEVMRVFVRSAPLPHQGDCNDDGAVDGDDIPYFCAVLLGTDQSYELLGIADMNYDGEVNAEDVPLIVGCLLQGECGPW